MDTAIEPEHASRLQPQLKVKPAPWIGFAVGIGFGVLVTAGSRLSGVKYTDIGATTSSVVRGVVMPEIAYAIVLALVATLLGWWKPVLRDKRLGVKWLWAIPIILILQGIGNIDYFQLSAIDLPFLCWAALATLLVGFNEELVYRGLALVAFRGKYKEVWVWFLTSLLFGLVHGVNILSGQSVGETITQMIFTLFAGTTYYVVRRVTGSLAFTIFVHALWDFGAFTYTRGAIATGTELHSPMALLNLPWAFAVLVILAMAAKKIFSTPVACA